MTAENIPNKVSLCSSKSDKGRERYILFTPGTIQFYNQRMLWYPKGKKSVLDALQFSPTTVLVWLMDDGSYKHRRLVFNTQGFSFQDAGLLAKTLSNVIQIQAVVRKQWYEDSQKHLPYIQITGQENLDKIIDYIRNADARILEVVEKFYGWKLSSVRKRDFLQALPEERQIELKLLPENEININKLGFSGSSKI